MSQDVLEKVAQLPPEKQQEVEDFVGYLLSKYVSDNDAGLSLLEKRRKNAGRMAGKIWMADDFNDTPEDFKDYL